jgi:hypothetical protein
MSSHTKSERSFVGLSRLRQMPEPRYEDAQLTPEPQKTPQAEAVSPFSWLKTNFDNAPATMDETLPQAIKPTAETKSEMASKPQVDIPFSLQSLKQAFNEEINTKKVENKPETKDVTPDVSFDTQEPQALQQVEPNQQETKTEKKTAQKPIQTNNEQEVGSESSIVTGLSPISSQELYVLQHKLYEAMLYLSGLLADEKASMDEIQPRLDALKTMIPLFQELQSTLK